MAEETPTDKEEVEEKPESAQEDVESKEEPEDKQVEEETPTKAEEKVEEKPPSRRENLRIQQLLEKGKRGELTAPEAKKGLDYQTELNAEPEVVKALEADRRAVSEDAFNQGISRAETIGWRTMLRLEEPVIRRDYPFLNPSDPENYNQAATFAMNQKYLRFVGWKAGDSAKGIPETVTHPEVSYQEFVAAEMEFADEIASQRVADSTKNIRSQAASTGLRPSGSGNKTLNLNKAPEDMTDEELDARIAQTIPPRARARKVTR